MGRSATHARAALQARQHPAGSSQVPGRDQLASFLNVAAERHPVWRRSLMQGRLRTPLQASGATT